MSWRLTNSEVTIIALALRAAMQEGKTEQLCADSGTTPRELDALERRFAIAAGLPVQAIPSNLGKDQHDPS